MSEGDACRYAGIRKGFCNPGSIKSPDLAAQQAIVQEINKSIYYIERNAHAKMLFHALTIRLYHILASGEEAVVT